MEFSGITTKWLNSLDYTFYKLMTKQDKLDAIQTLQETILKLKLSKNTKSNKTIQILQQKLDELLL